MSRIRAGREAGQAARRPYNHATMDTMQNILSLLGRYGYLVVFFGVMIESAGVPLPGETILVASGVLVHRGVLDPGDAVLFGALGAVVGDQIGYWLGRRGGRPFVLRWGRYVFITPERLGRAEAFFAHHGGKAVFLARFIAGLRVFGALVAGMSRMRWRTFFLYNTLGGAVWATAAIAVGYFLWSSLGLIEHWLGRASLLLAVLVALVLILHRSHRRFGPSKPASGASEEGRRAGDRKRVLVRAAVAVAIFVILAALLAGVYFGEWPWVWDLTGAMGLLLELL